MHNVICQEKTIFQKCHFSIKKWNKKTQSFGKNYEAKVFIKGTFGFHEKFFPVQKNIFDNTAVRS